MEGSKSKSPHRTAKGKAELAPEKQAQTSWFSFGTFGQMVLVAVVSIVLFQLYNSAQEPQVRSGRAPITITPSTCFSPVDSPFFPQLVSATKTCDARSRLWLRIGLLDANALSTNTQLRGIDGSIQFELNRPENQGIADEIAFFQSIGGSLADVIAYTFTLAVHNCGGPSLQFVPGRNDAVAANNASTNFFDLNVTPLTPAAVLAQHVNLFLRTKEEALVLMVYKFISQTWKLAPSINFNNMVLLDSLAVNDLFGTQFTAFQSDPNFASSVSWILSDFQAFTDAANRLLFHVVNFSKTIRPECVDVQPQILPFPSIAPSPNNKCLNPVNTQFFQSFNFDVVDGSSCSTLAATWIRAAFHDAGTFRPATGGGSDGSLQFELDRTENLGLTAGTVGLFQTWLFTGLSMADAIAYGAIQAVKACGGPGIPFFPGRKDATVASLTGLLPPHDISPADFRALFVTQYGFTPAEAVALLGAHTVGRVHHVNTADLQDGAFEATPRVFDNEFYKELVANQISSEGTAVINGVTVTRLKSDLGLMQDPEFSAIVNLFAVSRQQFFFAFASAFFKLTHLGVTVRPECFWNAVDTSLLAFSVPVPSSTLIPSTAPVASSTPIPSSTPFASSTPVASTTPVASLTSVSTSTPVASSTPVSTSASVASSTPVSTSTPVVSTTPAVSTTPSSAVTVVASSSTRYTTPSSSSTTSTSTSTSTSAGFATTEVVVSTLKTTVYLATTVSGSNGAAVIVTAHVQEPSPPGSVYTDTTPNSTRSVTPVTTASASQPPPPAYVAGATGNGSSSNKESSMVMVVLLAVMAVFWL